MAQFEVRRDDLHECRVVDSEPPELKPGEALLTVRSFGLTTNNITYAVMGETMSYWNFFPAKDGWGLVPVWGFADVAADGAGLEQGARAFGYWPPATHVVARPERVNERGFVDASPHRATLPAAYNSYAFVDADPMYDAEHEDEQMLLVPLFVTSFLIDDFFADERFFGADVAILSSASSKTALALAFLLGRREVEVVGLTSPGRVGFVEGTGAYDRVVPYDGVESLPAAKAIYVDMSGDVDVRAAVHGRYADSLAHSAVVGATHHDRMGGTERLRGPPPTFFFAPDRFAKRSKDWGRDGLETRTAEAWRPFVEWTGGWLEVVHESGLEAVKRTYLELLDGDIDPSRAHVFSPR
jgi:Protein of unknown function (DUF2855)